MNADTETQRWLKQRIWPRLLHVSGKADGLAIMAFFILCCILLLGVFSPWMPIPAPDLIAVHPRLAPPGLHGGLLGADNLGRDVLARVCQGIQNTFLVSTSAVLVTAFVGALLGLVSGYVGGAADEVLTRLADVIFSFPAVLLGLLVTAILGPGGTSVILAIVLITLPPMIRVVRAATFEVVKADFVTAARVFGASHWRILLVHLLPNVMLPILTQTAYSISIGILIESALSFLGLGVQPPAASLGSILREGSAYITIAPWLVFGPGIFLVFAILSINLLGEGLRHAVDPLRPKNLEQ